MQHDDELPPVPPWFAQAVGLMFSCYPQATMGELVPLAWWRHLHGLPREAIERALDKAPSVSSTFVPSAPLVREVASSITKTLGPKPDLTRPQLEEPVPEVSPEWSARFDEIRRANADPALAKEFLLRSSMIASVRRERAID